MGIRARYERGVFKPLDGVQLKEGTVVEVYIPTEKKKLRSVKDLAFTEMWRSRKDIEDGLSYVNRLRETSNTNKEIALGNC